MQTLTYVVPEQQSIVREKIASETLTSSFGLPFHPSNIFRGEVGAHAFRVVRIVNSPFFILPFFFPVAFGTLDAHPAGTKVVINFRGSLLEQLKNWLGVYSYAP